MLENPSELDLAGLRHEMRQLYIHLGFEGCLQVLYELMISAQVLAEIIIEEKSRKGA